MKKITLKNKSLVAGLVACLVIAAVTMSFQTNFGPLGKLDSLTELQDTIPENNGDDEAKMSIHEYDQLMLKMDQEIIKMQEEIKKLDLNKMHNDIAASLDKVDFDKIKLDIDKAMKQVDFKKIENGVKSALNGIDWNKMNEDVKLSLQEAKKEIEKVDMDEMKKEMEKAKIEIQKSKDEIKKINFDEIMKNANKEVLKAKEELRLSKTMFNEMEKEGLIRQKDGFSIELKNKTLYINGKKQSDTTREKYQKYIKGDSYKISIKKEN